jgi:hypothetical protein
MTVATVASTLHRRHATLKLSAAVSHARNLVANGFEFKTAAERLKKAIRILPYGIETSAKTGKKERLGQGCRTRSSSSICTPGRTSRM